MARPDLLQDLVDRNPRVCLSWFDHGYVTRATITGLGANPIPLDTVQDIYVQVATESDWIIESCDWLWDANGLKVRTIRLVQVSGDAS